MPCFESLVRNQSIIWRKTKQKQRERRSGEKSLKKKVIKIFSLLSKLGNLFDRLNDLSREKAFLTRFDHG